MNGIARLDTLENVAAFVEAFNLLEVQTQAVANFKDKIFAEIRTINRKWQRELFHDVFSFSR